MEKELSKLSLDDGNEEAQLLNDIIFKASSHDINVQLEGVKKANSVISGESNRPIDHLVGLGIIPILVDCLKKGNEELSLEATCTLGIIAFVSPRWAQKIVTAFAVPEFIKLLSSPNESLREWVVRTLDYIIRAGNESESECVRQEIIDHVVKSVTPDASSSFLKCVSQFVFNWYETRVYSLECLEKLLPVVSSLLTREDQEILFHSIEIISLLADERSINLIIGSGVVKQLVPFLGHDKDQLKTITLKTLGNIVAGTDEQAQAVLDNGLLEYFPGLLLSSSEDIVTYTLWFLSNITAGNQEQIQAIIHAGLIPSIISASTKGSDKNRREAAWAVSNISQNGSTEQIIFLVDNGVIPFLCSFLSLTDNQVLAAALNTMKNILKSSNGHETSVAKDIRRCGGLASIQRLEKDSDFQIHDLASEIINQFFKEKEEEESCEEPMNFEENC